MNSSGPSRGDAGYPCKVVLTLIAYLFYWLVKDGGGVSAPPSSSFPPQGSKPATLYPEYPRQIWQISISPFSFGLLRSIVPCMLRRLKPRPQPVAGVYPRLERLHRGFMREASTWLKFTTQLNCLF